MSNPGDPSGVVDSGNESSGIESDVPNRLVAVERQFTDNFEMCQLGAEALPMEIAIRILTFLTDNSDVVKCLRLGGIWESAAVKEMNRRCFVKTSLLDGSEQENSYEDIRQLLKDAKITKIQVTLDLRRSSPDKVIDGMLQFSTPAFRQVRSLWLDLDTHSFKSIYCEDYLQLVLPVLPNITTLVLKAVSCQPFSRRGLSVEQLTLSKILINMLPNVASITLQEGLQALFINAIKSSQSVTSLKLTSQQNDILPRLVDLSTYHGTWHLTRFEMDIYSEWHTRWTVLGMLFNFSSTLKTLIITRLPWAICCRENTVTLPPLPHLEHLTITHYNPAVLTFDQLLRYKNLDHLFAFELPKFYRGGYWFLDYPKLTELDFASSPLQIDKYTQDIGTLGLLESFTSFIESETVKSVIFSVDEAEPEIESCQCSEAQKNFKKDMCHSCLNFARKCRALEGLSEAFPNSENMKSYQDFNTRADKFNLYELIKNQLARTIYNDDGDGNSEVSLEDWLFYEYGEFNEFTLAMLNRWGVKMPYPPFTSRMVYPDATPTKVDDSAKLPIDRFLQFVRNSKHTIFLTGQDGIHLHPFLEEYVSRLDSGISTPIVIIEELGVITVKDYLAGVAFTLPGRLDIVNTERLLSQQYYGRVSLFGLNLKIREGRARWVLSSGGYEKFLAAMTQDMDQGARKQLAKNMKCIEVKRSLR